MKQTVVIKKEKQKIKINYTFEQPLYQIMKSYNGYYYKPNKCWIFPLKEFEKIKKDIKEKGYPVTILVKEDQSTFVENVFDEPDVIAVYGKCKKCGSEGFVNKESLCILCR